MLEYTVNLNGEVVKLGNLYRVRCKGCGELVDVKSIVWEPVLTFSSEHRNHESKSKVFLKDLSFPMSFSKLLELTRQNLNVDERNARKLIIDWLSSDVLRILNYVPVLAELRSRCRCGLSRVLNPLVIGELNTRLRTSFDALQEILQQKFGEIGTALFRCIRELYMSKINEAKPLIVEVALPLFLENFLKQYLDSRKEAIRELSNYCRWGNIDEVMSCKATIACTSDIEQIRQIKQGHTIFIEVTDQSELKSLNTILDNSSKGGKLVVLTKCGLVPEVLRIRRLNNFTLREATYSLSRLETRAAERGKPLDELQGWITTVMEFTEGKTLQKREKLLNLRTISSYLLRDLDEQVRNLALEVYTNICSLKQPKNLHTQYVDNDVVGKVPTLSKLLPYIFILLFRKLREKRLRALSLTLFTYSVLNLAHLYVPLSYVIKEVENVAQSYTRDGSRFYSPKPLTKIEDTVHSEEISALLATTLQLLGMEVEYLGYEVHLKNPVQGITRIVVLSSEVEPRGLERGDVLVVIPDCLYARLRRKIGRMRSIRLSNIVPQVLKVLGCRVVGADTFINSILELV